MGIFFLIKLQTCNYNQMMKINSNKKQTFNKIKIPQEIQIMNYFHSETKKTMQALFLPMKK